MRHQRTGSSLLKELRRSVREGMAEQRSARLWLQWLSGIRGSMLAGCLTARCFVDVHSQVSVPGRLARSSGVAVGHRPIFAVPFSLPGP